MDPVKEELGERFAPPNAPLPQDVLGELESMLRVHSISAEELYYKWESYSMKMGGDDVKMNLKTARDFKKDIQEGLERDIRSKTSAKAGEKRGIGATPRAGANNSDVYDMLGSLVPNTPRAGLSGDGITGSTIKRKGNFGTPAAKANKAHAQSSPAISKFSQGPNGSQAFSFNERTESGRVDVSINGHIDLPKNPETPYIEARIKLKANTEMAKFNYKTMAMKLSEASEILDDRIDEFLQIIQTHHDLDDSALGNPSSQSSSEIVAVGRIANDSSEGKLNAASLLLETSRRTGAGVRVPLKVDGLQAYNFFPGQIVAVRGTNPTGEFFTVTEVLNIPLLLPAASQPSVLDEFNARLGYTGSEDDDDAARPLNMLVASGPFTTDADFDFSAFDELLSTAISTSADALFLAGPFLDDQHPMVRSGTFPIPDNFPDPDNATVADLFRFHISRKLNNLVTQLPTCQVILIPSLRDAAQQHAAWPQDRFNKPSLGIPKKVNCVTNPVTLSFNELVVGMCSLDVLDMVRREECIGAGARSLNPFDRISKSVLEQRCFCPVFPPTARENQFAVSELPKPTDGAGAGAVVVKDEAVDGDADGDVDGPLPFLPLGAMIDTSYLKLGDWLNVRPDLLISPSSLTPFVRVVEDVCIVNPGPLCKRKGYGTYARMTVLPAPVSDEDRAAGNVVSHKLWERARVDIVRI